jgi:hypothetical protein
LTATTAEVQVLTAEVRVLMVGSRQVTLSVYRQLDLVDADQIEPFGRVSDSRDDAHHRNVYVIGRSPDGTLVRGLHERPMSEESIRQHAARFRADADKQSEQIGDLEQVIVSYASAEYATHLVKDYRQRLDRARAERTRLLAEAQGWIDYIPQAAEAKALFELWQQLPLIVLAGLR